jgi:NADPH-dependent curcumin reductase CurA
MSATRNLALIFKRVPEGLPIPGHDLVIEDRPLDTTSIPPGSFVVKNLYASLDPYMRMMLVSPDIKHYRKPFTIGEPLSSSSIAEVIRSSHSRYPKGSIIRARLPIQEYTIVTSEWLSAQNSMPEILPRASPKIPLMMWLGPLGMPGQTAYSSIFEIGKPRKGETIFISAASGAVGSLVGQICCRAGLRVFGSAGSDEKVRSLIDDFGFHGCFNYKTENVGEALARLCQEGIDIYYDNVGGEQLEAAIDKMNKGGRIVVCGMVSQYNITPQERYGIKNLFQFVGQGLTMRGFLVGDLLPRWKEKHRDDIAKWLEEGSIHANIDATVGIEKAADGFIGMLSGKNTGKAVVQIHA